MSLTAGFDPTQGGSGFAGGITQAISASPDLINTPGLALDAGGSLDPTTFAPAVSHLTDVQQTTQALAQQKSDAQTQPDHQGGGGLWNAIGHAFQSIPGIHGVEHALGTVAHYATAPLREIQRDYRFVHTVWTKNGPVAGILATLGVTAGAAVGAYLGGSVPAAILGGEGAAALERQGAELFGGHGQGYQHGSQAHFNEGLAATADASSDPHMKISLGRDLSNALGQVPGLHTLQNTDKGFGKYLSGGTDAAADWNLDPVVALAKFKTGVKLGDYNAITKTTAALKIAQGNAEDGKVVTAARSLLNGQLLRTMQSDGANQFLNKVAPGIQFTPGDSESLVRLWNQGNIPFTTGWSYRRAMGDIAHLAQNGGAGAIAARYPDLEALAPSLLKANGKSANLSLHAPIPGLASAKTAEDVHNAFVAVAENQHFSDRMASLAVVPTRTLTRKLGSGVAEWAKNIDSKAATVTTEGPGETSLVTRAVPRQSLTGATVTAGKNLATGDLSAAKDAITGAIARKVSTFSGVMPYALDPNTLAASTKTFSVDPVTQQVSPLAAKAILSSFSYSMGTQRARYWAGRFLNAESEGEQKRVWEEGYFEMLKAAGLDDNAKLIQESRAKINAMNTGPMGEPRNAYGYGYEKGTDVALTPAGDTMSPAAIWSHQASNQFSFPAFTEVKQAMREQRGGLAANYGKFDDFVNAKFISTIFKPLALLNAGFGLRVAFAESIPQAIRVGALQHLRDTVNAKAARMQYNLTSEEPDHILAATAHALGAPEGSGLRIVTGINRLLNDPQARERALGLIMRHDGHIAQGIARSHDSTGGYYMDQDPAAKAQQGTYAVQSELVSHPALKDIYRGPKDFDTFSRDSQLYPGYWHGGLLKVGKEEPARLIAEDLLATDKETAIQREASRIQQAIDGHPDAMTSYVREAPAMRAYDNIKAQNWTAQDFAANRVDAVRGLTTGADGTVHTNLLQNMADGVETKPEVLDAIDKESRPAQVYGRVRAEYIGQKNLMTRIINRGYKAVVDPIIGGLSRDPIFFNEYNHQLDLMQPAIDSGHLDQDTAERIAETRAVVTMVPKIHNTLLRSQFSVLARNYMPFYFAQEQALRRAGKLIATNPEAFRQYQLVEHGLNDPGFVQKDDQGNRYFIFPHIGALASGADLLGNLFPGGVQAGLPMMGQGSLSSLNTLLPDFQAPGVSPLMSIPLNYLTDFFPELSSTVKSVVGPQGFHQSALDALLPHPIIKAAWRVLTPDEKDASFANAIFTAMTTSIYEGSAPGPNASDPERAAWITRMKNNARSTFIVKGLLGLLSPLAPQVSNQTEAESGFRTEFFNEVKKSGYKQALFDFKAKHGTSAISYTVAHSTPTYPGAYMPYTNAAINALNTYIKPLMGGTAEAAAGSAFLIPQAQGPGDVQTIHAELVRDHLRSQDTPQDFLNAVDIALGNNAITPDLKIHQDNQRQLANNSQGLAAENKLWSDYMHVQHLNNPTWYNYWASPERTNFAYQAWAGLREIFNSKDPNAIAAAKSPQGQVVAGLLEDYANHALNMSQTTSAAQRKVEKANWADYLTKTANDNPLAYSVINAVFSRLDSAGVTPNGGGVA